MNVATQRDAVDCARLISIVSSQIHDCLRGRREFVFVTTNPKFRPTAIDRHELALSVFKCMEPHDLVHLLLALRDDLLRTRLCVERNDIIMRFAEYTVQRMTAAEREALCANI